MASTVENILFIMLSAFEHVNASTIQKIAIIYVH